MSTVALFSAVLAILPSAFAAPVPQTLPPVTTNQKLYTIPRTQATDTDGSGVGSALAGNPETTPLAFQEPDAPASGGVRFLAPTDSCDDASPVTVQGGYIRTNLPIPLSDPPATAQWMSINDNGYPEEGPAVGGQINFTTTNQGSDGGMMVDPTTGAIYLNSLTKNYAAFALCDDSYLAFEGTNDTPADNCAPVYLIAQNESS